MKRTLAALVWLAGACGSTSEPLGPQATACDTYCGLALSHCTRGNLLYDSMAACLKACDGLSASGRDGDLSGDTLQCRTSWLIAAARRPRGFCVNGGLDGGDACH
jgi:hypothetical protein